MMIDWNRVADLRNEIGAEDFDEVVEMFFEEVEKEIATIRSGCDDNALESSLHFLKGSALNFGFRRFSVLCQQGESAAGAGHPERVDLARAMASYASSKAEFIAGLSLLDRP